MKIGIVGDIHWSKYSSIVRSNGDEYTTRLENCIKSINWAENLFEDNDCSQIIYLGDFFDKEELNSEEITALKNLDWAFNIPHTFIVGNHEMGRHDLSFNSANAISVDNERYYTVADKHYIEKYNNIELCFLPYCLEKDRKSLEEYFNEKPVDVKRIIFSHNDIKDFQMGAFKSIEGFSIEEIENNCDLFINGHLHNGGKVSNKIINIGNLTGQNFSEDAFKYDHVVFILDTDTMKCAVYENPEALNFYSLDIKNDLSILDTLKNNAVVTVKCDLELVSEVKEKLSNDNKIVSYRVIANTNTKINKEDITELVSVNHIDKFNEFVIASLGESKLVLEELNSVLK